MTGKRALRYSTEADMPAGMRTAYAAALAKLELPVGMATLRQSEEDAKNQEAKRRLKHLAETNPLFRGGSVVIDGYPPIPSTPKPNKYGAKPTTVDGIRFDSKREAAYYVRLKLRVQCGEVRYFLRQVPLHLPGGTRLVVDFLEVHADGALHYIDVKGRETAAFKIKRREVEHHYPITIELA